MTKRDGNASDHLQTQAAAMPQDELAAGSSGQPESIHTQALYAQVGHPNQSKYPRQRVLVVSCDNYAYLVPFVEEEDYFFLKTVIPSRKATRDFLNQGEPDAEN